MASSFNQVVLMGNLTRDPELRYTTTGLAVADLGIAINRVWKDKDGQLKEEAHFFDVTAFGVQAENAGKYLHKGRQVLVSGELSQDRWEDKETGKPRSKVKVVARQITYLGSPTEGGGERHSAPPARRSGPPPQNHPVDSAYVQPAADYDDDVPF